MELNGLYQLIPVTKQMMEGIVITEEIDCFDLCDILRLKLTGYVDTQNLHIMNDWQRKLDRVTCVDRIRGPLVLDAMHGMC